MTVSPAGLNPHASVSNRDPAPKIGDRVIRYSGEKPPPAPAGTAWKLITAKEIYQYTYELAKAADPRPTRTLKVGDRVNLLEGQEPPPAPAGTQWQLARILETFPPQYQYELVAKVREAPRPGTPPITGPKVGDRVNRLAGEPPPTNPPGFEWQLARILETFPPQYQYELVAKKSGPAAPVAPSAYRVGDTITLRDGERLPKEPPDTFWQLQRILETFPVQRVYKLVAGDDA